MRNGPPGNAPHLDPFATPAHPPPHHASQRRCVVPAIPAWHALPARLSAELTLKKSVARPSAAVHGCRRSPSATYLERPPNPYSEGTHSSDRQPPCLCFEPLAFARASRPKYSCFCRYPCLERVIVIGPPRRRQRTSPVSTPSHSCIGAPEPVYDQLSIKSIICCHEPLSSPPRGAVSGCGCLVQCLNPAGEPAPPSPLSLSLPSARTKPAAASLDAGCHFFMGQLPRRRTKLSADLNPAHEQQQHFIFRGGTTTTPTTSCIQVLFREWGHQVDARRSNASMPRNSKSPSLTTKI